MLKRFIAIGALSAMVATILGAFAAHRLHTQFSAYQMHIFHKAQYVER